MIGHSANWSRLGRFAIFAAVFLGAASAFAENPFRNGISSGDTTQNSTVLWARSDTPGKVRFEVSTDPDFDTVVARASYKVKEDRIPAKVQIEGLLSGQTYYYRATLGGDASATGTFKTSSAPGETVGLRFGVSGDWRGELSPYPAINNAPNVGLDFFVELGDTIYADFPSPALPLEQAETLKDFRLKHAEVYSARFDVNTLADLRASTSVLATIDDHEVTDNVAGADDPATDPLFAGDPAAYINDTKIYENGLQVFQEYNPLQDAFYGETGDPVTAGERKLYRFRTYGDDAAVIVLDGRSFRDAPLPPVQDPFDFGQVATFLASSFDPARTMLGAAQLAELKSDLMSAQNAGITWKFVVTPAPMQNLGVIEASDRFEGYAAERTEILKFIDDNSIDNVVFITSDLHGTLVNNLTYQEYPFGPQIHTGAFEIVTGSVAFDAPFGPAVFAIADGLGLIPDDLRYLYLNSGRVVKDLIIRSVVDSQITPLGYDPLGLEDAGGLIDATELVFGSYVATHTFGWTQFDIDPGTQKLTVTTYGINAYTEDDVLNDPEDVVARTPEVVSQFEVNPAPSVAAVASASAL